MTDATSTEKASSKKSGKSRGAPRQLWVLMGIVFVDMIGVLLVVPLLPYYAIRIDEGSGGWIVGLLTSVFAAAQLLSAPLWGRLSDAYGRRPILLAGLLAGAAGYVFFAFATSLWMLFATRIMQGMSAGNIGVIQAYVSDAVAPKERAKALGWITAAASAGVTLGPIIGSQLERFGKEAPGLFAASLCVVNILFAWRLLPETRGRSSKGKPRRSLMGSIRDVVSDPRSPSASLIWLYTCGMMAFMALQSLLALYVKERFGIGENTIGWFYTYLGAVSVIMRAAVLSPVLDRIGEIPALRVGAASMTLGFVVLALAPQPVVFVLLSTFIPFGTALFFPTSTALLTQRVSEDEVGQVLGVQQSFRGVAGILGPAWAGAAFDGFGQLAPLLLCGAVMMLVFLASMRVHPVAPQGEEAAPAAPAA
ncbi:MAG: MFS transporter [Acidobacteriota bacterium]